MNECLKRLLAAVLTAMLASCGGGGGGGGDSGNSADHSPSPAPDTPAGRSGDSGSRDSAAYTGEKLAIFNAINQARARAGLAPLKQNTKLDSAAQGHATYIHLNGHGDGHFQTEGRPGYTGKTLEERLHAESYQWHAANEVISFQPDAVSSLLNTVYHRIALLSAETIDIGIGVAAYATANSSVTVIDTGDTQAGNHIANRSGYWVWPFDGASGLPVHYDEAPNPAPDLQALGYALSVTVNPDDTLSAQAFTLNCAGQDIPARLITAANDIHRHVRPNWVFLQPEVILPRDSTCTAAFQGSSKQAGRFNKIWSFDTAGG